jgi:hypothetical protein
MLSHNGPQVTYSKNRCRVLTVPFPFEHAKGCVFALTFMTCQLICALLVLRPFLLCLCACLLTLLWICKVWAVTGKLGRPCHHLFWRWSPSRGHGLRTFQHCPQCLGLRLPGAGTCLKWGREVTAPWKKLGVLLGVRQLPCMLKTQTCPKASERKQSETPAKTCEHQDALWHWLPNRR